MPLPARCAVQGSATADITPPDEAGRRGESEDVAVVKDSGERVIPVRCGARNHQHLTRTANVAKELSQAHHVTVAR